MEESLHDGRSPPAARKWKGEHVLRRAVQRAQLFPRVDNVLLRVADWSCGADCQCWKCKGASSNEVVDREVGLGKEEEWPVRGQGRGYELVSW